MNEVSFSVEPAKRSALRFAPFAFADLNVGHNPNTQIPFDW
jgi:hypothetical protein